MMRLYNFIAWSMKPSLVVSLDTIQRRLYSYYPWIQMEVVVTALLKHQYPFFCGVHVQVQLIQTLCICRVHLELLSRQVRQRIVAQ